MILFVTLWRNLNYKQTILIRAFFSYFVNPPYHGDQTLLEAIKEPGHTAVYGAVGSGKTTLRYALEAACRAVPDKTLVISLEVGKSYSPIYTAQTTQKALLEALATDLFVQLLEQHHLFQGILTPELTHKLSQFWQSTIPNFRRQIKRWLKKGEPESLVGISQWWAIWHRTIVSYTSLTQERDTFLKALRNQNIPITHTNTLNLQAGVELARSVGYKQVFVLLDVAGAAQINQPQLLDQVHHILENLFAFTPSLPLYLKGFLPLESKSLLNKSLQSYKQLTSPLFSALISWKDPELLQAIIVNRFRSAGSLIKGFEAIASQKIVYQISAALITAADESPRRLLQLVSLLITAHAQRDSTDPVITAEDWQTMCQLWGFGPPEPELLLTTTEPLGEPL